MHYNQKSNNTLHPIHYNQYRITSKKPYFLQLFQKSKK